MHKPKVGEWIRYVGPNDNSIGLTSGCIGQVFFIRTEDRIYIAMGVDWKLNDSHGFNWKAVPYRYGYDTLELIVQPPVLITDIRPSGPELTKPKNRFSRNIMDFADQVAEIIKRKETAKAEDYRSMCDTCHGTGEIDQQLGGPGTSSIVRCPDCS